MINSIFLSDSYKMAHPRMLPAGTTLMYGNCTPRSNKYAPEGLTEIVSFGQQLVVRWLKEHFQDNFFDNPDAVEIIKRELELHYGAEYDVSHFQALHDLGYLPLKFKALPEGTLVPVGVPVMTWYNTHPDFAWLSLFVETPLSTMFWKLPTSATMAHHYRSILSKYALETDEENLGFVDFQGHDFSARGMSGIDATWLSGLGHLTSFLGSDTLATIPMARKYYDEVGFVNGSVPASEHSVSSACIASMGEQEMISYYMKQFPKGILSIVSDTFDLWKVLTTHLPELKEEILARDGKIVIRPDSGDPVDIICGRRAIKSKDGKFSYDRSKPEYRGVIELLWDVFGGTVNKQGYKILDPHIGAIYGDSITPERAKQICERLEDKGFASTNVILGVGSFTYQFNTRDTWGFAMKATYCEVVQNIDGGDNEGSFLTVGREIFKDPITDDGTKKSAKGLLKVEKDSESFKYVLKDQVSWEEESSGFLQVIFKDGNFNNPTTLTEIRERLKNQQ